MALRGGVFAALMQRVRSEGGKMKLYHYSVLFMILFCTVAALAYGKEKTMVRLEKERQLMDRCVDTAADAAAAYMATYSDGRLQIDKDEVQEVFLGSLFSALGVLDRLPEQERVRGYITCMVIVDENGYFLWHPQKDGVFYWEEKVFFEGGNREELLEAAVLGAVQEQEELRRLKGKTYRFELPTEEGFLKRGMAERGLFVLLRGIPESGRGEVYEHFAFSGAVLYKIKR